MVNLQNFSSKFRAPARSEMPPPATRCCRRTTLCKRRSFAVAIMKIRDDLIVRDFCSFAVSIDDDGRQMATWIRKQLFLSPCLCRPHSFYMGFIFVCLIFVDCQSTAKIGPSKIFRYTVSPQHLQL